MKKIIAALAATFLLQYCPAVFAQSDVIVPQNNGSAAQQPQAGFGDGSASDAASGGLRAKAKQAAQAAIQAWKGMTPPAQQQLVQEGIYKIPKMTPEQLKEYRDQFNNMSSDQKQQLPSQVMQQLQSHPDKVGTVFAQNDVLVPPDTNSASQQSDSADGSSTDTVTGGVHAKAKQAAQAAIQTLKDMTPEQRQQLIQEGMSQIKKMSPDQINQYKAQFDNLSPDQKQQLQSQAMQQLQTHPELKDQAIQQLQSMTPEQQQELMQAGQQLMTPGTGQK